MLSISQAKNFQNPNNHVNRFRNFKCLSMKKTYTVLTSYIFQKPVLKNQLYDTWIIDYPNASGKIAQLKILPLYDDFSSYQTLKIMVT